MINKKIAVFFDCENIHAKYVPEIFNALTKRGEVIIKQGFNDWSCNAQKWTKAIINEYAMEPIQVFKESDVKNTVDMRMQRGVYEVMSTSNVDTIVIVASDIDFRDLAITVKSKGIEVIGFGEKTTKEALRNAYSIFYELPINETIKVKNKEEIIKIVSGAIDELKDDNEYANFAMVASYLSNKNPSYNCRNFGYKNWGKFFESNTTDFITKRIGKNNSTLMVGKKYE